MSGEVARFMARRFSQRDLGIAVSAIRTTGQIICKRRQQEPENNTPTCDLFGFSDIPPSLALIARKALVHNKPVDASELAKPYQRSGEKGLYSPTTGRLQILIYNTKIVTSVDVPWRGTDLPGPKFKHRVVIALGRDGNRIVLPGFDVPAAIGCARGALTGSALGGDVLDANFAARPQRKLLSRRQNRGTCLSGRIPGNSSWVTPVRTRGWRSHSAYRHARD